MPFDWRENNCMSFVSGALEACGLSGLPSAWCGGYANTKEALLSYRKALAAYGHEDIVSAMDARYQRVLTLYPTDGMICSRETSDVMGRGFGIVLRGGCVFLTPKGAQWTQIEHDDLFWRAS